METLHSTQSTHPILQLSQHASCLLCNNFLIAASDSSLVMSYQPMPTSMQAACHMELPSFCHQSSSIHCLPTLASQRNITIFWSPFAVLPSFFLLVLSSSMSIQRSRSGRPSYAIRMLANSRHNSIFAIPNFFCLTCPMHLHYLLSCIPVHVFQPPSANHSVSVHDCTVDYNESQWSQCDR